MRLDSRELKLEVKVIQANLEQIVNINLLDLVKVVKMLRTSCEYYIILFINQCTWVSQVVKLLKQIVDIMLHLLVTNVWLSQVVF